MAKLHPTEKGTAEINLCDEVRNPHVCYNRPFRRCERRFRRRLERMDAGDCGYFGGYFSRFFSSDSSSLT